MCDFGTRSTHNNAMQQQRRRASAAAPSALLGLDSSSNPSPTEPDEWQAAVQCLKEWASELGKTADPQAPLLRLEQIAVSLVRGGAKAGGISSAAPPSPSSPQGRRLAAALIEAITAAASAGVGIATASATADDEHTSPPAPQPTGAARAASSATVQTHLFWSATLLERLARWQTSSTAATAAAAVASAPQQQQQRLLGGAASGLVLVGELAGRCMVGGTAAALFSKPSRQLEADQVRPLGCFIGGMHAGCMLSFAHAKPDVPPLGCCMPLPTCAAAHASHPGSPCWRRQGELQRMRHCIGR